MGAEPENNQVFAQLEKQNKEEQKQMAQSAMEKLPEMEPVQQAGPKKIVMRKQTIQPQNNNRRMSNMDQLKGQIEQRFAVLSKNKFADIDSEDENETSSEYDEEDDDN